MPTAKEEAMQAVASALNGVFKKIYGQEMGFFLTVFEFHKPGISDFISNGEREQIIKSMEETAKRFRDDEIIPTTIGEA